MNKIQKMIHDLCPNGVEWKTLGECCEVKTGKLNANAMEPNGIYPFFTCSEQIYSINSYAFDCEALLVAGNGFIGNIKHYKGKFNAYQRTYVLINFESSIIVRYLYFYLLAFFREYAMNLQNEASVPYITLGILQNFSIPIPPLEVQAEIVNLLDKFTQLSAELKAELKLRRKQYDYYRNHLLSFDSNSTTVHWMPLGEVAEYAKERIAIEEIDENNYVSVENLLQDRQGVTIASSIPNMESCIRFLPNDILIGNIRPYLRKIWLADKEGGTNGDVLTVRIKPSCKDNLLPRFLYHNLASESFFLFDNQHAKGAKMPRGDKNAVMQYLVPIPPMEEQERIVGILDKFETLVNDLSKGLPAEIALVQKQYEYYRNMLLTFE